MLQSGIFRLLIFFIIGLLSMSQKWQYSRVTKVKSDNRWRSSLALSAFSYILCWYLNFWKLLNYFPYGRFNSRPSLIHLLTSWTIKMALKYHDTFWDIILYSYIILHLFYIVFIFPPSLHTYQCILILLHNISFPYSFHTVLHYLLKHLFSMSSTYFTRSSRPEILVSRVGCEGFWEL